MVVVDKTPLGLRDELVPMLEQLRERGRARIVLGLRNVEDDPERVRAAWAEADTLAAVERFYDRVVVYGPGQHHRRRVELPRRRRAAGAGHQRRLRRQRPATTAPDDLPEGYLLVTVGGGSDGHDPIEAVLDADQHEPLPYPIVIVTGPLMSADDGRPAVATAATATTSACSTSATTWPTCWPAPAVS